MNQSRFRFRARFVSLCLLLAMCMTLLTPLTSYAEESNRNEVRANLSQGGWHVVYGDLLNEADYLEFAAAVAAAIATENPGPIYKFFNNQLQAQITKIQKSAPQIAQDALIDLLLRAFKSQGKVFRHGQLEMSAGIATYKRWERVVYDEPRTKTCWTKGIIKTKYPCVTMERVERKVPYPNNFQPYLRFRWTGGNR